MLFILSMFFGKINIQAIFDKYGGIKMFSGINNSMSTLHLLSDAKTRSICAENFTGEKGKGGMATEGNNASRELGQGWKMSPKITLQPGETFELANIEGPGAIQHIWCTFGRIKGKDMWRDFILRFYWWKESSR